METTDNQDELFVVVDKNDKVVGYRTRKECHQNKTLIHRSVGMVISNAKGEILLQKRSLTKDLYPGFYSSSCSGHLKKGEDYQKAAEREIKEELGVARKLNIKIFKKIIIATGWETEMYTILLAKDNGPFNLNLEEIEFVKFFPKHKVKRLFKERKLFFEPYAERALRELKII